MTREHYEKYERLSEPIPTKLTNDLHRNLSTGRHIDNLAYLYGIDEHLNNIPLIRFDAKFSVVRLLIHKARLTPHGGLSLAENVYILKHILIFRVLEKEAPPLC